MDGTCTSPHGRPTIRGDGLRRLSPKLFHHWQPEVAGDTNYKHYSHFGNVPPDGYRKALLFMNWPIASHPILTSIDIMGGLPFHLCEERPWPRTSRQPAGCPLQVSQASSLVTC